MNSDENHMGVLDLPYEIFSERIFMFCTLEQITMLSYTSRYVCNVVHRFLIREVKLGIDDFELTMKTINRRVTDHWMRRLIEHKRIHGMELNQHYDEYDYKSTVNKIKCLCCKYGYMKTLKKMFYDHHIYECELLCLPDACQNGRLKIVKYLYRKIKKEFRHKPSYLEKCVTHSVIRNGYETIKEITKGSHWNTLAYLIEKLKEHTGNRFERGLFEYFIFYNYLLYDTYGTSRARQYHRNRRNRTKEDVLDEIHCIAPIIFKIYFRHRICGLKIGNSKDIPRLHITRRSKEIFVIECDYFAKKTDWKDTKIEINIEI